MRTAFHTIPAAALVAAAFATGGLHAGEKLPAFPGAEGFGADTPGGRKGRVIPVTNLNDRGPGSLRAAVEAEGPRTVVFRTGGTIEVDSSLQIKNPFLTIAGQSAPGGGITLKNSAKNLYAPLQVKTHDVVIRHLRSRPGPSAIPPAGADGSTVDALTIADPQHKVYNVVIDHCSFSWAVDEVVNSWYDARDITVQWCIIAEGLHRPKDRQGAGSKGALFGGKGSERISFHHNLLAHNVGRNPMVKASGVVDVVNNVLFVPATIAAVVDGELGVSKVNFVGNQVLAPKGDGLVHGIAVLGQNPVSLYVRDNLGPYRKRDDQPQELSVSEKNNSRKWLSARRHDAPAVTTTSAAKAYEQVLRNAGCTLPVRDAADERVVAEVQKGRTRMVDDPAEVGGWPELAAGTAPVDTDRGGMPDEWEQKHGLDPRDASDGAQDLDGDGYTNVEEFLNGTSPRNSS
jgi:pectate lyase